MSAGLIYGLSALFGYFVGSIPFGLILTRLAGYGDIRKIGSGNIGATNVLRTGNKTLALLTVLCDAFKAGAAAAIAGTVAGGDSPEAVTASLTAGAFGVLGHNFPVWLKFKGGKGVATSLGVLLMTNWQIGLICLVFALVLMALSKMVSLGSVGAAILFPVLVLFIHTNFTVSEGSSYLIYSIILAVIVAFNHRSNIKRILNGTENKLSFKK